MNPWIEIDSHTHVLTPSADNGPEINALLNARRDSQDIARIRRIALGGDILLQSVGMDLALFRAGTFVDGSAARILASCPMAAIDTTASTGIDFFGIRLDGTGAGYGFFAARNANKSRQVSGKHTLTACRFGGEYTGAAVYVVGAESIQFNGTDMENNRPDSVATTYLSARNVLEATSNHPGLTPGNSTSESACYLNNGCHVDFQGDGPRARGAIVVHGFDQVVMQAPQCASKAKPYVLVDSITENVASLRIHDLVGVGNGNARPSIGVDFVGSNAGGLVNTLLTIRRIGGATFPRPNDPGGSVPVRLGRQTYRCITIEHSEEIGIVTEDGTEFAGPCLIRERTSAAFINDWDMT